MKTVMTESSPSGEVEGGPLHPRAARHRAAVGVTHADVTHSSGRAKGKLQAALLGEAEASFVAD